MSFNLFGPATICDIKVGYISTDRGYVDGISRYEANQYAALNPGTQFIFKNRDLIRYLNINEVINSLLKISYQTEFQQTDVIRRVLIHLD